MLLYVQGTNPSPVVPILLIVVRSPVVFVILLVPQCLMLLAIGLMRKVRTIRISTRLHWFMWHYPSSFCCSKKSPQDCSKWTITLYGFRPIISYHTIDKVTIGHAWSHLVNFYKLHSLVVFPSNCLFRIVNFSCYFTPSKPIYVTIS